MICQFCRNVISMLNNGFNNVIGEISRCISDDIYPVTSINIPDSFASMIAHVNQSLATFNMASAYFNNITIALLNTVCNNNHTAVSGQVRFNDIPTVIVVGSKISLNMSLLVEIMCGNSIVYAIA